MTESKEETIFNVSETEAVDDVKEGEETSDNSKKIFKQKTWMEIFTQVVKKNIMRVILYLFYCLFVIFLDRFRGWVGQ